MSHLLPREGIYFLHIESVIPALAGVLATDQNNQTIKTEQISIFGIYFKMCFSSFINDNKDLVTRCTTFLFFEHLTQNYLKSNIILDNLGQSSKKLGPLTESRLGVGVMGALAPLWQCRGGRDSILSAPETPQSNYDKCPHKHNMGLQTRKHTMGGKIS